MTWLLGEKMGGGEECGEKGVPTSGGNDLDLIDLTFRIYIHR